MIIHTIRNYMLYIKFRLALAFPFQGNFHMRCHRVKKVLYELNSINIIRSETLSLLL